MAGNCKEGAVTSGSRTFDVAITNFQNISLSWSIKKTLPPTPSTMKKILAALFLLLGLFPFASTQSFTNAKSFGAGGYEIASGIVSDQAGSFWVLGSFSRTTEIAGESRTSAGGQDGFLAKFNPNQELTWLRTFGGPEDDGGRALVLDSAGNVYVLGRSEGNPQFGALNLTGFGESDITLSKYDTDGNLVWAHVYGGAGVDFAEGILLQDGQLYLTGTFEGTATFGSLSAFSNAERAAYVLKVDAAGNSVWLKKGICYDRFWDSQILGDGQGNLYYLGQFAGLGYFGTMSFEGNGFRNYVLIKMTADGSTLWAKQIRKVPNLMSAWAPDGGILLAGTAGYDFEIDQQIFPGGDRMWVARMDTAGHLEWLKTYAEENAPNPRKLVVASGNSIYLLGAFHDSLTMGTEKLYSAAENQNKLFLSHLDEYGNVLHSIQSGNFGTTVPQDLHFATDSTLWMAGNFLQTVTMGHQKLKSNGNNDIFIASLSTKFLPQAPSTAAPTHVRIYPNPTDGFLNLDTGGYTGQLRFELYSLEGKLLQSNVIYPGEDWVFLEVWKPGMYLYRVTAADGKAFGGRVYRR